MKFDFSIRAAIAESWTLFKQSPWFLVVLSLLMVLFNFVGGEKTPTLLLIIVLIASIVLSYVWLSVSLAAVDGKRELLQFDAFRQHLPTVRQFFYLIGVGIMTGLFVLLGFIALIIPGVYIMVRLMFAQLAYVDRKGGVMANLRYSWHMVKGDVFWTVFLTMLLSFGLTILGIVCFGIGLLVTYPLAMLVMAQLYRALTEHQDAQALVVQPEELPAADEAVEANAEESADIPEPEAVPAE